jgi:hypothetical protein
MGPFCFDFNCKDQPIMVSLSTWSLKVFWSWYHWMFIGWSTIARWQCGRTSSNIHQYCSPGGSSFCTWYKYCLILTLPNDFFTLFSCFDFKKFDRERKAK